ncbi:magnesium ion transporter [Niveomyces insectorum RCEF 264]|uniref:Magnesium ion transporter n=1 Tax=Niveomyces insectorum RCEF 264 TaxID=1081102 RepID=A0A167VDN5_9HYPO|nr:magnesium ion transporter [Niveomyces insectorum RCEF 264]
MGIVVSCIGGILSAIGACLMGIVNAIGAIIMAIVNGVVTVLDVAAGAGGQGDTAA